MHCFKRKIQNGLSSGKRSIKYLNLKKQQKSLTKRYKHSMFRAKALRQELVCSKRRILLYRLGSEFCCFFDVVIHYLH